MRALVLCLFLVGCSTAVPVARKFPDAPETLMTPCVQLKKIEKEDTVIDLST